jgi:hypothetical protein
MPEERIEISLRLLPTTVALLEQSFGQDWQRRTARFLEALAPAMVPPAEEVEAQAEAETEAHPT